ncbi:MAG TPA: adenylate/guanylate cyclase domain-containing protein [Gemmatimonadota bacterium]|nr:adenylate/guanylate cyclase domain-containing protein [Gemmatimonadota bacterium]
MSSRSHRLAAIWFADIAGYTELSTKDEDHAVTLVELLQEAAREAVRAENGRIVKHVGDAVLAEFQSTTGAVRAALELKSRFAQAAGLSGRGPGVLRIGVHVGEVVPSSEGDVYGEGVNVASRLQECAAPGEVWVTEDVWRQIRQRADLRFEPRGEQLFKGFTAPILVYAVMAETRAPSPSGESSVGDGSGSPSASIAVLPFTNMSASAENEFFSDGVTEEILTTLARVEGLKVISRTSVMRYKGTAKPLPQIGRELGVANLLEGSVRQAGRRVRITAQLIDARTDQHLWAERYDRELEDIFAIQSDVAQKIVEALKGKLTSRERARITDRPTTNVEAYEWYLKGRFLMARRTSESFRQAMTAIEKSLEMDSEYARAWSALAALWSLMPYYTGATVAESATRTREAAERALELDPALAEPHAALGAAALSEWKWDEAGREYRKAIELAPSSSIAHQWYGNYLMFRGRPDDAIASHRRAVELDPLSLPARMAYGSAYYFADRFEEALAIHREVLELDPGYAPEYVNLAGVLIQLGRFEEAIEAMEMAAKLDPDQIPREWVAELREGYERGGERGFREAYVEGLRPQEGAWARDFNLAAGLANLGRTDEALALLEKVVDEHQPISVQLGVQPSFDVLMDDPRFQILLERVGVGAGTSEE